MMALW